MKEYKWNDLCVKDKISYAVATIMIFSGILIAFLSFFLNSYNIATGILIYIAQTFVVGGSLLGAQAYFRSKWIEFNTNATTEIEKKLNIYEEQKLEQ